MDNVVEIVVRSKNETKVGFDSARVDAAKLGDDVGDTFSKRFADKIINLRARIKTSIDKSGSEIGDSFGESIHKRITERLKVLFSGGREKVDVDVDVDEHKQSFLQRMTGLGKEGGDKLSGGIGGSLQTFFSGDLLSLLVKVVGGAALGGVLGSVIAAAISSAILLALGGGVIGAGIALALKDPQVKTAVLGLKNDLGNLARSFGDNFRGYTYDALRKFSEFINSDQVKRFATTLGQAFGPLVGSLSTGFISMLQNALPGIQQAALAAAPLFQTIADHAPQIGDALSKFFKTIADNGPAANQFLDDLLAAIEFLLPVIGNLIKIFADWYIGVSDVVHKIGIVLNGAKITFLEFMLFLLDRVFAPILIAASEALGWIPGIGPKLHAAQEAFTKFRKQVNAELAKIKDKTVNVTIAYSYETFGKPGTIVATTGGFSAKGRAAGGVAGAAAGGIRDGMTWVGEQGPELLSLPAGSTVHSASDSQRMSRGQGAGGGSLPPIVVQLIVDGETLATTMVEPLREKIRTLGAGSAQRLLGQAGVA